MRGPTNRAYSHCNRASNTATRAALERETGRLITKAKSHPQVENLTGHMVKFPVRLERDLDPYGAIVRLDRVPRVRLTDPHPPGGEARPALAETPATTSAWRHRGPSLRAVAAGWPRAVRLAGRLAAGWRHPCPLAHDGGPWQGTLGTRASIDTDTGGDYIKTGRRLALRRAL